MLIPKWAVFTALLPSRSGIYMEKGRIIARMRDGGWRQGNKGFRDNRVDAHINSQLVWQDAQAQANKIPTWRKERGHRNLTFTKLLFTSDSCWERKKTVFFSEMTLGTSIAPCSGVVVSCKLDLFSVWRGCLVVFVCRENLVEWDGKDVRGICEGERILLKYIEWKI